MRDDYRQLCLRGRGGLLRFLLLVNRVSFCLSDFLVMRVRFQLLAPWRRFFLGHFLVRTRVNELLMVAVATFFSAYLNTVKRKMKSTRLEAVWRQACNREFLIKILPYSKPKWGIKTWVVLSRQVIVQRFKSPLFVLR